MTRPTSFDQSAKRNARPDITLASFPPFLIYNVKHLDPPTPRHVHQANSNCLIVGHTNARKTTIECQSMMKAHHCPDANNFWIFVLNPVRQDLVEGA